MSDGPIGGSWIGSTLNRPVAPVILSPEAKILMLIREFRCLRGTVGNQTGFDATIWEKRSRAWSSGERQAALFILAVWSGHNWKGKPFNIVHAVSTLDPDDKEVIIRWMREPFYP